MPYPATVFRVMSSSPSDCGDAQTLAREPAPIPWTPNLARMLAKRSPWTKRARHRRGGHAARSPLTSSRRPCAPAGRRPERVRARQRDEGARLVARGAGPLRRRRDQRRRGLPEEARGARGEAEHEREAEPVGQRGDRALLLHAALRAALPDPFRGSRRGGSRDQRMDRALLQPAPTAHDAWEREPKQLRIGLASAEAEDIINLSTESRQAQTARARNAVALSRGRFNASSCLTND